MARIRTIKPEFPQSESMGRVSREARLCYILLWTLADDSGRLRGNSRMLASLLYPYDDDAGEHMEGWLSDLARAACITRYEIAGNNYVQINAWLEHQKIDKPSQSKIPPHSGIVAKPREDSSADQGRDQGVDQGGEGAAASSSRKKKLPKDFGISDRVRAWAKEKKFGQLEKHLEAFITKATAKGYVYEDWDAAFQNCIREDWGKVRGRTKDGSAAPPDGGDGEWHETLDGLNARALELGLKPYDGLEQVPQFRARVVEAHQQGAH